MAPTYIILHGPPACGKTLNKEALRKHYKCDHVLDAGFEDCEADKLEGRVMILSCDEHVRGPHGQRKRYLGSMRVPVAEAKVALGERWIEPVANDKAEL